MCTMGDLIDFMVKVFMVEVTLKVWGWIRNNIELDTMLNPSFAWFLEINKGQFLSHLKQFLNTYIQNIRQMITCFSFFISFKR